MIPQKINVCSCHLSFCPISIYRGVVVFGGNDVRAPVGLWNHRCVLRALRRRQIRPLINSVTCSGWWGLTRQSRLGGLHERRSDDAPFRMTNREAMMTQSAPL